MSAVPAPNELAPDYNTADAFNFLKNFLPNGPWHITAIDPAKSDNNIETKSFGVGQVPALMAWLDYRQGTVNIYFSVNRVRPDLITKRATKADIVEAVAFHADVDPRKGEDLDAERLRILAKLRGCEPPPSVIVDSGGGYQGFWLLDKPVPVDDPAPIENRNRWLEKRLDGDHTGNIDRIMRLPGTANLPTKNKIEKGRRRAPAVIVEANWGCRYSLDDLPAIEAPAPTVESNTPCANPREVPRAIASLLSIRPPVGERSEVTFRIIRELVEAGFDNEAIIGLLVDAPAGERYGGDCSKVAGDVARCRSKGDGDVRRAQDHPPWPTPLDGEAFYGLAGEVVRAIEPHSEADPAALLIQFLTAFGNCARRKEYYQVEGDRHYGNIYAVLVGETSKARKGTSWSRIREMFDNEEDDWIGERVSSGMSSGEGLIWQVRDPIEKSGRDGKPEIIDEGVSDKRLLVQESEFAGVLRVMMREGNTLSRTIRDAWDRGDIASMTKNSPARATGAHISIVGHITADELKRYLDVTETANGFANRFIFICVRRSKLLPLGGSRTLDMIRAAQRLKEVMDKAGGPRELKWSDAACDLWCQVYDELSDARPGMFGAVTARAEAHVVRLAVIYAMLDKANEIEIAHLRAALAVWRYAQASAGYIFGTALGDSVADTVLTALRSAGAKGMTRTLLSGLFGRHQPAAALNRALAVLLERGLARQDDRVETAGRPAEVWLATSA